MWHLHTHHAWGCHRREGTSAFVSPYRISGTLLNSELVLCLPFYALDPCTAIVKRACLRGLLLNRGATYLCHPCMRLRAPGMRAGFLLSPYGGPKRQGCCRLLAAWLDSEPYGLRTRACLESWKALVVFNYNLLHLVCFIINQHQVGWYEVHKIKRCIPAILERKEANEKRISFTVKFACELWSYVLHYAEYMPE